MFNRLQKKWKVSNLQLLLVLFTFAIGGSLTGYAGRKLINIFDIDQKWLWIIIYLLIIVLLWPLAVLLVSVFTGQFRFFSGYIIRMGKKIGIIKSRRPEAGNSNSPLTTHIAIFASGAGSNAQKIIEYFASNYPVAEKRGQSRIIVSLIVCNNPAAGVLKIAAANNIPTLLIEKEKFFRSNAYVDELQSASIDFIVLAGFLWKLPVALVKAYRSRIVNIHPALLPKYGGKGMYGDNVHAAVIAHGEKESGITIHYVDGEYDHGAIIFQAKCPVLDNDTPSSLAQRIHRLEHEHYPVIIKKILSQ